MEPLDLGSDHPLPSEIRAARAYAGMSRKQVGDALGVSAQVIGRWERGQFARPPAQAMLEAIARATNPPTAFEFVSTVSVRPSVAERARAAAQRLDGTQRPSSETGDAPGAEDGGS